MISIVIATLNRADALNTISLPSLLRQDMNDFEVVVWDASKDDASKKVCQTFYNAFSEKKIALRYFKAPRQGLASQRNDASQTATGDIVFFIDDDCEVSVDAIRSLDVCFKSFPWLYGAGLPMLNKTPASGNSTLLKFATRLFGMKNGELRRKINRAGGLSLPIKDLPGPAEWLSGGSMAYRKTVFNKLEFEERLETFGGYALGEDVDFSHRVMLEFNQPLMVVNGGYVIHHKAIGGDRNVGINKIAAFYHNPEIIRRNFEAYGEKFGHLWIKWDHLATVLAFLRNGVSLADIRKGKRLAMERLKTN